MRERLPVSHSTLNAATGVAAHVQTRIGLACVIYVLSVEHWVCVASVVNGPLMVRVDAHDT
jgi:hypothetical protein